MRDDLDTLIRGFGAAIFILLFGTLLAYAAGYVVVNILLGALLGS